MQIFQREFSNDTSLRHLLRNSDIKKLENTHEILVSFNSYDVI